MTLTFVDLGLALGHSRCIEVVGPRHCRYGRRQESVRRSVVVCGAGSDEEEVGKSELGVPLVIAAGEVLMDYLTDDPDAKLDGKLDCWRGFPGGAPANVTTALTKLETASAFVGAIGDDEVGAVLREELERCRVNVEGVVVRSGRPTRCIMVRRSAEGERSFVGFRPVNAKNEDFADAFLRGEDVPGVLFYAGQFLVTGTLSLAFEETGKSIREVVEFAKSCKLKVLVDVNWRPLCWSHIRSEEEARSRILSYLRSAADIVKISDEEAQWLLGIDPDQALETPVRVMDALGSQISGVLVTAGERGAAFAFRVGTLVSGFVPSLKPPGPVVDTTGAGDAFTAGFISELIERGGFGVLADIEQCQSIVGFAAATGALTVTSEGAMEAQPTRHQVEAFMRIQSSS